MNFKPPVSTAIFVSHPQAEGDARCQALPTTVRCFLCSDIRKIGLCCVRGHLLITPVGESALDGDRWYIAEIYDIPTASEPQLECPKGSDKLSVRFNNLRAALFVSVSYGRVLEPLH
jgi:hypothetical protein